MLGRSKMAALNMDKIPGSVGYQILNEEGAILSSFGELEYDEVTANRIYRFLHIACKMPLAERKDYWKRIMVLWEDFMYVITVSNRKIYVCKRIYQPEAVNV
ncbi:Hypothetical predicted protein [Octopus vulgaris]|uniref:Late endosomal/lysosomal adaptor and MAPK and MTOR activator 4 n=4 Tax=Octopus TaxID=6643 RepID=A0AA36F769_OCTVU|nr:Hypothetical predicted protein [Octopus vulgaris]